MQTKILLRTVVALMAVLFMAGCERTPEQVDPREPFFGRYSFVSTGSVDVYAGSTKMGSIPLDETGEFNISAAEEQNAVLIVSADDTTKAYVSGNLLFINPETTEMTFGEIVLHMQFVSGNATLTGKQLSWATDVQVDASYGVMTLTGNGRVEVVATKE